MPESKLSRLVAIPFLLLSSAVMVACGGGDDAEPSRRAVEIVAFTVEPEVLDGPGTVTASWEIANGVSMTLRRDGERIDLDPAFAPVGSVEVDLEETTTFELIATGSTGVPAVATRTVEVRALEDLVPLIGAFEGPEAVSLGEGGVATATLSWSGVLRADELLLERDQGETQALDAAEEAGTVEVELDRETSFELVARNAHGEARESLQIRVVELPQIDVFTVDRSWVGIGETVELQWNTIDAARVELWVNGVQEEDLPESTLHGVWSVAIDFTSTIELRAFNEVGAQVEESLEVVVASPEVATFEVSGASLWFGETLEMNWLTHGGREVTVRAGEEVICLVEDSAQVDEGSCGWQAQEAGLYNVQLTVSNGSGVASSEHEVFVGTGPAIEFFTVEPDVLTAGEQVFVSWSTLPDPEGTAAEVSLTDDQGGIYPISAPAGEAQLTIDATPGVLTLTLQAATDHALSEPATTTAEVLVHGAPEVTLVSNPPHFGVGDESLALEWTSAHAESLILYRVDGEEEVEVLVIPEEERAAGSYSLVPLVGESYRIVAENALGATAVAEVSFTVEPPSVVLFEADPLEITAGQSVFLRWDTSMADEVELSIFDDAYVVEEWNQPYVDVMAMGGTHLPLSDACGVVDTAGCEVLTFPEGFTFPFAGEDRSSVRVYGNGFLSFAEDPQIVQSPNDYLPSAAEFRNVHLAPFWDALGWDTSRFPQGNIHWILNSGSAGEHLIIQWRNVGFERPEYRTANVNFEVVLWPNGQFEYRYGEMDSRPGSVNWGEASSATIGYQLPDGSDGDLRTRNQNPTIRGTLVARAFLYTPTPQLEANGTYLWHPYSNSPTATATLTVKRGDVVDTETVTIQLAPRPELTLVQRPEPTLVGEDFRIQWETFGADQLAIYDEDNTLRCHAESQFDVDAGFCTLSEDEERVHRYRIVYGTGAGGLLEQTIEVLVYEPFGIDFFEADEEVLEYGDPVTLSWETVNAPNISLLANGVERLPDGAPSGPGSLVVDDLEEATTFILRVTNSLGLVVEESVEVEMWKIRLEVSADETLIRPGDPVTVTLTASGLTDDDPDPVVYGNFPMVEVEGEDHEFNSIVGQGTKLEPGNMTSGIVEVEFSGGFRFPYFGEEQMRAYMHVDGYLSFTSQSNSNSNEPLPTASSSTRAGVHLAPFWDDIHLRSSGELWAGPLGTDAYVFEWSKVSLNRGSTSGDEYNLNFQVILFSDGSFEYRYGVMDPLPPPATHANCWGDGTCAREAAGSSVTVGYQNIGATSGHTVHFGATSNNASEPGRPFDGGFAGRSFRYEPRAGDQVLTVNPHFTQTYLFCADSGFELVCKSVEVEAPFEIESFEISDELIDFGDTVTLSWETVGGKKLVILENDTEVYSTEDYEEIDEGTRQLQPPSNAVYTLQLLADENEDTETAEVEVIRLFLTSSAPETSPEPGAPIQISWQLTKLDTSMQPVIVAPMEEVQGRPFSEFDLSQDLDAEVVFAGGVGREFKQIDFPEGFTFPYLGQEKSWVKVMSVGYLSFAEDATSVSHSNQELPSDSNTYRRVHIAPFWEDLHTRQNGRVLAKQVNTDTFVIQWSHTSVAEGSSDTDEYSLNFMVVLRRNGEFEFRYGNMIAPAHPASDCGNHTCENLANGSSATIGYQEPTGLAGFNYHYANNSDGLNKPVAGGLNDRTLLFQPTSASGSVTVAPWDTRLYQICTFDPATGDVVCAEPMEVEVEWGIRAFDATPWAVLRGDDVELSWEVVGLDGLQLLVDGVPVYWEDYPVSPTGSYTHTPTANTTYLLEGTSLGREVEVERVVQIRAATVSLEGPAQGFLPGQQVTVSWDVSQHEDGDLQVLGPMTEVPAGAGDPHAFVDISEEPGATALSFNNQNNGRTEFELPFSFPYFGAAYDKMFVYLDGYLSFATSSGAGQANNEALPGTTSTRQRVHIAPFWDDLHSRNAGEVFQYAPDQNTLILQWTNFSRNDGSNNDNPYDMNFQVVLFSDGSFEYRYGKLAPPALPTSNCYTDSCALEAQGASATIGYATVDASFGYNVHFGGNGLEEMVPVLGGLENRAFRFDGALNGSFNVRLEQEREYTVCADVGDFRDCQTIVLRPMVQGGDVMFTELMIDPTGGAEAQWFELRNLRSEPIDLEGFVITTRTGSHTVGESVPVPAKGFVTLAASSAAGISADYVYGTSMPLHTSAEDLTLVAGTATIGSVSWGGSWFIPAGQTLGLDPSLHKLGVLSNDAFDVWCAGAGSPGSLGTGCIYDDYDVDPSSTKPFIDISQTGTRIRDAEDNYVVVPISTTFSMPFFDGVETPRGISSDGWITFSEDVPSNGGYEPPRSENALPRQFDSPPSPILSAFWDLLRCDKTAFDCQVHLWEGQIDGVEALIVQWSNFKRISGTLGTAPGSLTFQAQLYANGEVVVAFADAYADPDANATQTAYYRGSQAWIALEGRGNAKWVTGHQAEELDLNHRSFHFTRK